METSISSTDQMPQYQSGPNNPIIKQFVSKYSDCLEVQSSKLQTPGKKSKGYIDKFSGAIDLYDKKIPSCKLDIEEILKKSVITTDFENLRTVPPIEVAKKKLKTERKIEREKTHKWFGSPAREITEEMKTDLEILKMRSVLDPKHFYKKNDLTVLPKYFQMGKILDSPLDYYNRLEKQGRKRTLIDELLADAEFTKYSKRKYKEIIQQKEKTHYKAYRKAKKLKRKNKK